MLLRMHIHSMNPASMSSLIILESDQPCFLCFDVGSVQVPMVVGTHEIFPARRLTAVCSLEDSIAYPLDTPATPDALYRTTTVHRYCVLPEELEAFKKFVLFDISEFADIYLLPKPLVEETFVTEAFAP